MAPLGQGQVLLFGGFDGGYNGETWVYDLSQNTWTEKTPAGAPSARYYHAMAPLGEGRVLLFGGNDGAPDGETWVYDLSANSWANVSPAAALSPPPRTGHAMAPLGVDQVLLFGGFDAGGLDGETWVYDLSADSWTNQTPGGAPSARDGHRMAPLGGDQALLFGGNDGTRNGETWVYDLSADSWTNKAPVGAPSAREGHAMARLGGDQALLFGGWVGAFDGETWVYDLSQNSWTNQSPAPAPPARDAHAMAWLGEDQVLLFGGSVGGYPNNETWVYDLSQNSWINRAPPAGAPSARYRHAMAWLGGGQVLLFGGYGANGRMGDTWVYDLSTNTWRNKAPTGAPSARIWPAMAPLGEGRVLLFGGWDAGGLDGETWVYDLSQNRWTNQAPADAPSARSLHAMAPLGRDQVLLFGGSAADTLDDGTWVYDLRKNRWTNQAPAAAPSARNFHVMAPLGGGQALLFGGIDESGYDGETWVWWAAPRFQVAPVDDWVQSSSPWTPGATISLTIEDGTGVVYADSQTADGDGNFHFSLWDLFDLQRGHVVTVSDGTTTKTHTVTNLFVDGVDVTADTVFGRADAGADVHVWVHGNGDLTVTADGAGHWTADFSGMTDLTYFSDGGSDQMDSDGDATGVWWASPRLEVAPDEDWVQSWSPWTPSATVSLSIEDGGSVVYTDSQTADANGSFHFSLWDLFDLQRGHVVTVSDGTTTKTHTVTNLFVDGVDVTADTVFGRADAGTSVEVRVHGDGTLTVDADGSGNWTADFSGMTDLTYSSDGGSQQTDDDGDSTGVAIGFFVPLRVYLPLVMQNY